MFAMLLLSFRKGQSSSPTDNKLSLDVTDIKCISNQNCRGNIVKARIKAARDLLGMTQAELCAEATVPLITLRRVEGKPDHVGLVSEEAVGRIVSALEKRGIQFLEDGQVAEGPGVAIKGKPSERR